jgi:hypothetical protein
MDGDQYHRRNRKTDMTRASIEDAPRRKEGLPSRGIMEIVNKDAVCLLDADVFLRSLMGGSTREWPDHFARFFQEVRPHLAVTFAEKHGISRMKLVQAYESTKTATGRRSHAFEQALRGEFVFTS